MGQGTALLVVLAAVYATAGVLHLFVWLRNRAMREHWWFALACGAAAAAVAAISIPIQGGAEPWVLFGDRAAAAFSAAWLVATTWFAAEYANGDHRRHRIAALVTAMLAFALLGDLMVQAAATSMVPPPIALRLLNAAALLCLLGMVVDGTIRLWRSARHFRALVLGGGVGIALVAAGVEGALQAGGLPDFPSPIPYAFVIVVMLMAYGLADTLAQAQAASQRQRQELAHASRLSVVGELTASIAHEINQPLGAILSNADAGEILLEQSDPPLDEIRQILADIHRDGLRATDVIRHVRMLVRQRELVLERFDANVAAAHVIALLEPEARRRRVSLASALSAQPVYLLGDRALIEQVLINLVLNAMDSVETMSAGRSAPAMGSAVVLGVSTGSHGEIEFQLVDAGTGIPTEHLGHLFDSFHTTKPHGMGLGLSIVRSIVEAHGGRIQAENNRDAGATFRVTLPPCGEPGRQPFIPHRERAAESLGNPTPERWPGKPTDRV